MSATTFEQRLTAGPPALRTVARRAQTGDLVYSTRDGQVHEVTFVYPVIVGVEHRGVDAVSLTHREPVRLAHRDAVVLTKAEAEQARDHYAAEREAYDRASMDAEVAHARAQVAACVCVENCAEHPPTACSLSGTLHVHPDDGSGTFGPCPIHPDAPGDQ